MVTNCGKVAVSRKVFTLEKQQGSQLGQQSGHDEYYDRKNIAALADGKGHGHNSSSNDRFDDGDDCEHKILFWQ